MSGLKEIRRRLDAIKSAYQLTNAMKMVSVAKLKKLHMQLNAFKAYAEPIYSIYRSVDRVNAAQQGDALFGGGANELGAQSKVLIVAVSSNAGLCGGFNNAVYQKVVSQLNELEVGYGVLRSNVHFIAVGKRIEKYLHRAKLTVIGCEHDLVAQKSFADARVFANALIERFKPHTYSEIRLVYNKFSNSMSQACVSETFLPISVPLDEHAHNLFNLYVDDKSIIFEPSVQQLLDKVVLSVLEIQIYLCLLNSQTSEHSARIFAMHKSSENATGLQTDLKRLYNKLRQAAITKELLEIITGAEALKKKA